MESLKKEEFLTAKETADLLKIPTKTVTQLAREKEIPGKKYGKHWRFLLSDIIKNHTRENAVASSRKEVIDSHGDTKRYEEQDVASGFSVYRSENDGEEEVPTYDWNRYDEEEGDENRA